MKRFVTILLLIIYASSIAGIGIKTFYCCNKVRTVSAVLLLDRSAGSEKRKDHKGCCDTKYSFFKVKDNHKAASGINAPLLPLISILFDISHPPVYSYFRRDLPVAHRSNAPPPFDGRTPYMMNCVYRI